MSKDNKDDLVNDVEKDETQGEQLKPLSKEDLEAELEDIKEMFEEALESQDDELAFASEVNQIQELDDIDEILNDFEETEGVQEEEEEEDLIDLSEVDEDDICENCHKRLKSTLYEDDYPFCDHCVEELASSYKFPLRITGVLATFVVLLAIFFCGWLTIEDQDTYVSLQTAQSYYDNDMLVSAVEVYNEYLSSVLYSEDENVAVSRKAIKNFAEIFAYNGQYEYAVQVIEMFYTDEQLDYFWNSDLKAFITVSDELTLVSEVLYDAVGEYLDGSVEFDLEEQCAVLDALKDVDPIAEGLSETLESYPEVFIEYYKFILMTVTGESYEDQLAQLEFVDSVGEGYEWLYLTDIWSLQMYLGDTESAEEYFERTIENNIQDSTAYYAYASVFRYLDGDVDTAKMIEIADRAQAVAIDGDYTMNPIYAIAYLLEGDTDAAVEVMAEMINGGTYTLQGCNLYALCCLLSGYTDGYDDMIYILEANGYSVSEYVTAYENGEMTLEEVLTTQGGDM